MLSFSAKALLAFSLFLALSLAVVFQATTNLDLLAQEFPWPAFLQVFLPLGSHPASLLLLLLISLLLWQKEAKFPPVALFLALFLLTLLLEIIAKTFIATSPAALFTPLPFMEGTYPSGHMIRTTLFAGFLCYLTQMRLFLLLPLLQALAMLAVDGHTLSDLLGGALLSVSALYFFLSQYPPGQKRL